MTNNVAAYRDKAKVLFTYFQIVSQQVGGCITVPWPSGYGAIIRKAGVSQSQLCAVFQRILPVPSHQFLHDAPHLHRRADRRRRGYSRVLSSTAKARHVE